MDSDKVPDDIRGIEEMTSHAKVFVAPSSEMDADEMIADMLRTIAMMAKMVVDKLEVDARSHTPADYLVDSNGFFMIVSTNINVAFRMTKVEDEKWMFEVSQGFIDTDGECTCDHCDDDA